MTTPANPVSLAENPIASRIAETLAKFPPFSMMDAAAVGSIAESSGIRVRVAGEMLWNQGDTLDDHLLFLAKGRVEYFRVVENVRDLIDVRDVGDLLGLTALLDARPCQIAAEVVEDSLFYAMPWKATWEAIQSVDSAREYVHRHLFWATRLGRVISLAPVDQGAIESRAKTIIQAHLDGGRVVRARDPVRLVTCAPETSLEQVARLMRDRRISSILVVDDKRLPLGMITANDLVARIIARRQSVLTPVAQVMSSPVVTVSDRSSASAALLLMMQKKIGQVCVTQDGTTASPALDICSDKDLLTQSGYHPAGLIRELSEATDVARCREICDEIERIARSFLEGGVSSILLGQICAEFYDELVGRLLALAADKLGGLPDDVRWAWISVGSDGRREQILRTDMDNAMIFASTGSVAEDDEIRRRLLTISTEVISMMVDCGFSRCQGGVMASNPRWCRSDREWLEEMENEKLLEQPEQLLQAMILFDLRYVAGDGSLVASMRERIQGIFRTHPRISWMLAKQIVESPPPISFFGNFVLEKKGNHAAEFDLKSKGLAPLRDAARLYALHHGLTRRHSTGGRWEEIARHVEGLAELATLASQSFDQLQTRRTLNGFIRGDSGRYLDPSKLTKLERAQLTNVFDVVRMVQQRVSREFGLD